MPRRRHVALLCAAALTGSVLVAGPSWSGPTDPGLRAASGPALVHFGDSDRAQLSPAGDSGRQMLQPLPRPDGTTPGMIVTSDGRSTTLEAADSNAAPVLIDGTATPFAAPYAASDDELVELRFEVIGRDGRPGVAHINVYDVDDASVSAYRRLPGDPEAECTAKPSSPAPCILVPPGTYSLMGLVKTMPADQPSDQDQSTIQNLSLVGDPEVEVTADRTFTFDARRAHRVEVQTPGARTSTNDNGAMELGYYRTAATGQTIKVWQRPGSQLDQSFYMEPTATVRTGGLQTLTRLRLEAPAIELDAPRTDDLHPAYYKASWFSDFSSQFPLYDGRDRLRVVDAGHATADDLAGRDLRGALAVVERSEAYSVAEQSNRAAAAGAVLVAVYNDGPGDNADPNGTGRMLDVPTVRLSRAEGRELLDLRRRDRVEVRGEAVTPYVYDMVLKEKGRIRQDPVYVARRGRNGNLSEQVRGFHGQPGIGSTFSEAAYPWQPGDTVASSRTFPLRGGPQTRTEYRFADPDTRWRLAATTPETKYNSLFPHDPVLGMLLTDAQIRTYAAGERVHKPVGAAPVTAGPNPAAPFERTGDRMRVVVSGFLDADGNYGISHTDDSGMSTQLEIRADDELIAATTGTPQGTVVLPQGGSRVSISFTADNPQSWTELSTHTETEWTFDSAPAPAEQAAVQPAIVTDYDVDVDLRNRTRDRDFRLELSHLDGSTAPIDVTVEASYDDGETWKRAKLRGHRVTLPRGDGFVSLRVRAHDDAGSELAQQIIRAWYVR